MARQKNTLIYSRKAYNEDTIFARNVLETSKIANSQEHHTELLQEIYPTYIIEPLYTYEHTGMFIERTPSCRFDSSADAYCAYKDEKQLEKRIEEINCSLQELEFSDY